MARSQSSFPPASPDLLPIFGRTLVPVPTGAEAAAFDRHAIDVVGVPEAVLMENAGRSAALVLDRIFPRGKVAVLAGRGNNGGDGIVLARTLRAAGREVRLVGVGRSGEEALLHGHGPSPEPLPDRPEELGALLAEAEVVVDALLGTGVRGAPRGPLPQVIREVNRSGRPVLALDLPSGVDADSGTTPGAAVAARVTVAFGAPKLGTLLHPGRERAGRLVAVEIGFPPWPEAAAGHRLITPGWVAGLRPRRALRTHKNAEGRLLLLAGRPGMAGAAVLAARAALRAGAGFVRIASDPRNREILQSAVPEAVFVDALDGQALLEAAAASDALAAGPGMGTDPSAGERLGRLLEGASLSGLLLDADALTLLGRGDLPDLPGTWKPTRRLLTPHPGELGRIVGEEVAVDGGLPGDGARAAARRWNAVCLLKGTPSVVAPAGGEGVLRVSGTGSSDLARAGMGDVLTGVAGAFLARGLGGADAASVALHLTGRAAALAPRGGEGLLPSDVADGLPEALREQGDGRTELHLPFVTLDLGAPR
jgi:ADP-dependent NAD(P)H-hydrate dehydratase / NAD(P)H-hydrate epimerase